MIRRCSASRFSFDGEEDAFEQIDFDVGCSGRAGRPRPDFTSPGGSFGLHFIEDLLPKVTRGATRSWVAAFRGIRGIHEHHFKSGGLSLVMLCCTSAIHKYTREKKWLRAERFSAAALLRLSADSRRKSGQMSTSFSMIVLSLVPGDPPIPCLALGIFLISRASMSTRVCQCRALPHPARDSIHPSLFLPAFLPNIG